MKIKNVKALCKRFLIDIKNFSINVAVARFLRDVPFGKWEKRRERYENAVLYYLDNKYGKDITEQLQKKCLIESMERTRFTIWVMWLQGVEQMPPLVKACYKQLKRIVPQEIDIQLLTEDNVSKFVCLSDTLLRKYRSGKISATHLSDIVRAKLLAKYGGCWVDATIWFECWPNQIKTYPFFTLHAPGLFPEFIFRGNWTMFLMSKNDPTLLHFHILVNLYEQYWAEHDYLIDYLLCDYFFRLIIEKDSRLKTIIEELPENRHYYSLKGKLNNEYNKDSYENIMKNSPIQKLSYKGDLMPFDENGKITFYGNLLQSLDNDKLEQVSRV